MQEFTLIVPTYLGKSVYKYGQTVPMTGMNEADRPMVIHGSNGREMDLEKLSDFGKPKLPVHIHEADGVRIVLGAERYEDNQKPDIQIERRPNGWAIFLHPLAGSDPSGYIYFLDDGRSFLIKGDCIGPTDPIQVLEPHEDVPELDRLP